MKKILFTSEAVVEICNQKYHKTSFQPFIDRYSFFGKVIFCSYCKTVKNSQQTILDTQNVDFVFLEKETNPWTLLSSRHKNKKILYNQIRACDIVVAHLPSAIGIHAINICKDIGKPYFIGIVGCAWDAYWNYGIKGKLYAPFAYLQMRKAVKEAPLAFYVTQKFLQKRYPNQGINIGCSNVELSEISKQTLENRLSMIEKSSMKVIKIGTVAAVNVRYKGQEYVIKALKKLNLREDKKYHYYLVGGGDNSYLSNVASKYGVTEYVHFMGAKPHEEIYSFLDSLDIYIQPSRQEGLPRAVIEAMSRALPVFGANTAGIPELLAPECIFENGDIIQIEKLLYSLNKIKMAEFAIHNFKESHLYSRDILDKRRSKFYHKVLSYYHNGYHPNAPKW
uniref:glycosyltransferase n=1 Tax=Alistipes sp. TaxID=1872444 RepID=UPI0040565E28